MRISPTSSGSPGNHTRQGQRPPREGTALCQGIVRCGACGHSMSVRYRAKGAHYDCPLSRTNHIQTPGCRSVKAAGVDELVARRLLAALAPEEIAVALAAADEVSDRRARSTARSSCASSAPAMTPRVPSARFTPASPRTASSPAASRPAGRHKLRELADAEAELAEQTTPAPEPSREQLEALARDVPALWAADSTSEKDRKRLLRALIADVTITTQPDGRDVAVGIRWRSGAAEQHTIQRPPSINDTTRTPPETVELITRLAPEHTNTEIADQLNAAGLRTGKGLPFDEHAVRHIRRPTTSPPTPARRRRADRQPGRRAPRHLARRDLRLDLTRQARRPPRPRNRLRIPFDPARRAGMPRAGRELQPHTRQTKIAATGGAV